MSCHTGAFPLFHGLFFFFTLRSVLFRGSQASWSNSIPSFCFKFSGIVPRFDPFIFYGFSNIVPRFDPFVLFQVLRHHARIQSLHFVSGSPALCSDLIPSFCFRFSGIMLGFDPLVCLGFSSILPRFDPFVLFQVLWNRAPIQSLLFLSGSPTTCPDLAHLFWHRARISL